MNQATQSKVDKVFENRMARNTKIGKLQDEITCRLYWIKSGQTTFEKQESTINMYCDEINYIIEKKAKAADLAGGKLVEMLKEQTQSLKEQYIERCVAFAKSEWDRLRAEYAAMSEINSSYCEEWNSAFSNGIEKSAVDAKYSEIVIEKGYVSKNRKYDSYYPNALRVFQSLKNKLHCHRVFVFKNVGEYLAEAEKKAIEHYKHSIIRLAARIEKKELNQAKLEMVTSHIDVNIETTIFDGEKTVRAWTIIAEGPVQRPHYRYLVKL